MFSDGRISVSSTLAAGQRSELGRKDLPCDESLPGFGNGMMVDIFQMDGRRLLVMESLYSAARKFKTKGPRCLRWKMVRPSGQNALLLLQPLIAAAASAALKVTVS